MGLCKVDWLFKKDIHKVYVVISTAAILLCQWKLFHWNSCFVLEVKVCLFYKLSKVLLLVSTLECSSWGACSYHLLNIPDVGILSLRMVVLFIQLMAVFIITSWGCLLSGCINKQLQTKYDNTADSVSTVMIQDHFKKHGNKMRVAVSIDHLPLPKITINKLKDDLLTPFSS